MVVALQEFMPGGGTGATMTFMLPAGSTQITAYGYCNKHGLWASSPSNPPTYF
jgi:desulfoferrodoxin (superoxide reductase-like protein)